MIPILSALIPVFLLIFGGYAMKRSTLVADSFWGPAEKITYFVFFPALLVRNTSQAAFDDLSALPMAASVAIAILTISLIAKLLRPKLGLSGPAYTSFFQGTIRPNVYLGVATAAALYGEVGLTLVSICIVVGVPLVNLLSVVTLVRHAGNNGDGKHITPSFRQTIGPVIRNPLIIACLTGAVLNFTGLGLPPLIDPLFDILGRAALPIGLLAVGAGLDPAAIRPAGKTVALASFFKLLILPLTTWVVAQALGVSGPALVVSMVYASLPVSATSYVLARQMGGDAPVLAGIITATTLIAMLSLPGILYLVNL